MTDTVSSDFIGLWYAEQVAKGNLGGSPIWRGLEPNTFGDFGGDTKLLARSFLSPSRQMAKGSISDLDVPGGFNQDLTQTNLTRLLQGFLYANAREKPKTRPFNGTAVAVTSVAAAGVYNAASGLAVFPVGSLVLAKGFTNAANNGLSKVSASASGQLTLGLATVVEAAPPASASLTLVGYEYASGAASLTVSGGIVTLGAAGINARHTPGEWIFIGGDAAGNQFAAGGVGYARVAATAVDQLTLDKTSFAAVSDAGTGKLLRIFVGDFIRNEDPNDPVSPAAIVKRYYTLQRTLGQDTDGTQSQYLNDCTPNQLTLTLKQADKLHADLTFVALGETLRTGLQGQLSGTYTPQVPEEAFNMSTDMVRMRMSVIDLANSLPMSVFGYVTESTIVIDNHATALKALGVIGGFASNIGDFSVSGSVTAYLTDIAAIAAMRANADVTFDAIVAQGNTGVVIDLPLIGTSGGRLTIAKNQPIMLPVTMAAGKSRTLNFTVGMTFFPYLPNVAMPI